MSMPPRIKETPPPWNGRRVAAYQLENGAVGIEVERFKETPLGMRWIITHSRTIEPGAWAAAAPAPAVTAEAVAAATWAVNMENGPERRRLIDGHRARRVPVWRNGFSATDYSAADQWLIGEHAAATSPEGVEQ